ncbi:uncharacterized protein Hf [Drosophila tropicalis]|uniref:uncharacterized protein Hf n=1 Tax=Drosophila tropicalis TaxID=46794 RepID=UPI0035AB9493
MSRSELLISIVIGLGLISHLTLGDSVSDLSVTPTALSSSAVEGIERLYNQVLQRTIEDAYHRLIRLNDSSIIDRQYFEDLDTIFSNEDYYSTAYYIFAWINSDIMMQAQPDKLLAEVLPVEKEAIRNFYTKLKIHLEKYLRLSRQNNKTELLQNVTRWQSETQDTIVMSYIEFPRNLQKQIPELQLMDYTKLAKALLEGVAAGIWKG